MVTVRLRHGRSFKLPRGGQIDNGIIAQWRDGFQRHVTGALNRPFVVLFEQNDQQGG
jgi:hypothetical protein